MEDCCANLIILCYTSLVAVAEYITEQLMGTGFISSHGSGNLVHHGRGSIVAGNSLPLSDRPGNREKGMLIVGSQLSPSPLVLI